MKTNTLSVFILGALLVAGCGGGGNSSNSGSSSSITNLNLNATPTAKLASSQTSADALATEIQQDAPRLVRAVSLLNLKLTLGTLPSGTGSGSLDCATITGSGSGSATYNYNFGTTPTVGGKGTVMLNSCVVDSNGASYGFNGSLSMGYTRFNNTNDYALLFSYSNFTLSATGNLVYTYGPLSGSFSVDYMNGTSHYISHLSDGSVTDIASVNYASGNVTITTASYVYNSSSAAGIVKVDFSNWVYDTSTGKPVSGTVTVMGANGDSVVIVANGSDYTVTYTINGVTMSPYTVTY